MKAITRIKAADNPSHLAVIDGEAGSVSKYVQMEADTGMKRTSMNTYQHAVTYMQFQEEAIKYAQILYDEMAKLAQQAVDPMTSDTERAELAEHFEQLRKVALNLNHETYKDAFLFEERASSTDFAEDAEWKLQWASHEGSGGNILSKDVIYSEGKISLRVNSGNRGERYELIQGDPDGDHVVLFDSGNWRTKGEANNYDFDEFIIEWKREQETFFHSPESSTGDGLDTPKGDATPYWITPTEDATEVADAAFQQDELGRNLWIGSMYVAEEFSSDDAENNVYEKFDIISYSDKLWLLLDDAEPVEAPVVENGDENSNWQEITFAGNWQNSGHSVGQIVAHDEKFWLLAEATTATPSENIYQWKEVGNDLVGHYANLLGHFDIDRSYNLGEIVSSDNPNQQGNFWLLTGTQTDPPANEKWRKQPYRDTAAWTKLSREQADEILQYWTFNNTNWKNFLWDGDHKWVETKGALKQALLISDEVNPALHSYQDLYKARSPNPNDSKNEGVNEFDHLERAAVFEMLDKSGNPILEFTAAENGAAINDYTFEINTNQTLHDAQAAIIDYEGITLTAKTPGFAGNKIELRVDAEDFEYAKIETKDDLGDPSGLEFTAKVAGDDGNKNRIQIIESKQATANIGGVEVEIKDTFLVGENGNDFNPTNDDIIIKEDFFTQSFTTIGGVTVTIIAKDGNPLGAAGDGTEIVVGTNTQASVDIGGAILTVKPSADNGADGAESNDIQIEVKHSQSKAATLNLLGLNLSVKEVGTGGNDIEISVTENDSTVTGIVYDEGAGTLKFENALTTYNLGQLAAEFTFPESNIFNVEAPTDSTINLSGAATDEFITAGGDGSKDITYNLNGSTHQILLPHSDSYYNTNAERRKEFEDGVNNLADITDLFDVDVTSSTTPIDPDTYKTAGGLGSTPTGQIHYDNSFGHKIWLPTGGIFDSEDLFNALSNDQDFTGTFDIELDAAAKDSTFDNDRAYALDDGEGSGSVEARYDAGLNQLIIELPNSLEDEKQEDIATAINSGTGGRFSAQATNLTADASDSWDTDFANGVGTDSLVYVEDLAGNPTGIINLAGGPGAGAKNSIQNVINAFEDYGSTIFQSAKSIGGGIFAGTYQNTEDTKGLTNSEFEYTGANTNDPILTLRQGVNTSITHSAIVDKINNSGGLLKAESSTPGSEVTNWPAVGATDLLYTSYSSQGTLHDKAKLETHLGRDEESVRYSEDKANKRITIDLRGDSATPQEILLAYEAWRNSLHNGVNDNNPSSFKTPVILDEAGRNDDSIQPKFRIGGISAESSTGSMDNKINDLEILHNIQATVDIGGAKITVKPDLAHGEDSDNINIEVEYASVDIGGARIKVKPELAQRKGSNSINIEVEYNSNPWTGFYDPSTHKITLPDAKNQYDSKDLVSILRNDAAFSADFDIEQSDTALASGNFTTSEWTGFYEQVDPFTHKITLPYLTNKYDSRDLVSILKNDTTQATVDIGGAKITVKTDLAHGEDSNGINIEVEYNTSASWTDFYDPVTHKITLPEQINEYDSTDLVSILENHDGFSANFDIEQSDTPLASGNYTTINGEDGFSDNFDIEQSDTALASGNYTTSGGEGKAPTAENMHYDQPTKTLWLAEGAEHTNQTLHDYLNGLDASNSFWTDFEIDQGSLAIEGNASQTLESITYSPLARLKTKGQNSDIGTADISATSQMDGNRGTAGAPLTGKQGQVISKSSNPNMIDSSKLSLRVTPGDTDPEMIDNSFQAVVHYTPPEKLEEKSIGDESEFGGTLLSLGLGLLRFGEEVSDKNLKGQAISIDTYEKALEAINSLARETNDLAKQVNRLGENKSKASMTLDHLGRQFAIRKDLSTHSPDDIIEEEVIRMQEIEILRDYHISLLHKVMRVNEDMVRMLIIK